MGKGSGHVCGRAPMVFGGGVATASQPMLDPASAWREHLEMWMESTDLDALEAEMMTNTSFIERTVIAYRITELRGKSDLKPFALQTQPTDDELRAELLKHQHQGRALFVEGSGFQDGLLYASMTKEKAKKTVTQFVPGVRLHGSQAGLHQWPDVLNPDHPDGPDLHGDDAVAWCYKVSQWTNTRITCKDGQLSEHDVMNALKRRRNTKLAAELRQEMTDERLETLVEWVWSNHSYGTHQLKTIDDPSGKEGSYTMYANVDVHAEHELIEHLVENGAKVTDNPFVVPAYASWATLDPGKRFSLQLPDGGMYHYVPHHSVGKQKITTHRHSITIPPLTAEQVDEEIKRVSKSFDKHKQTLDMMVITEEEYHNEDGKVIRKVAFLEREKFGKKMVEMAETGEEVVRGKGHPKYERTMRTFEATEESMAEFAEYMVPQEDGTYMYNKFHNKRAQLEKEARLAAKRKPVTVSWTSSDPNPPDPDTNPAGWQNYLAQLPNAAGSPGQINRLKHPSVAQTWEHAHDETVTFKPISHGAPMSERGTVRIEGTTPEAVMQYMQTHGMAKGYTPLVPYDLVYPGRLRLGRVIPKHHEYATGEKVIKIPDDHCVIHGMTGVQNATQAIQRLKMIHQYGGLKSISERSRIGLGKVSMSPKGDIASGIDHGVPTKVGNNKSYGSRIFFIMKPDVLERRDCWFSNQDFGGGHNRYDSYNQYASSIGQGKMHQTASHAARQKHINSGLGNTNEAYLKHEVSWDEISVLLVDSETKAETETLVKKWKAEGSVPKDLRVESFTGADPSIAHFASIGKKINKAYRKARGQ